MMRIVRIEEPGRVCIIKPVVSGTGDRWQINISVLKR
jgi:hypothetical protein